MPKNVLRFSLLIIFFLFLLSGMFLSSQFVSLALANHIIPNCDYKRVSSTNGPPFCSNPSSSSTCEGFGPLTGTQCCTGLGYDTCSDRQVFPGGPPGPFVYELYCCNNPPTPTPLPPTGGPTPTISPPPRS